MSWLTENAFKIFEAEEQITDDAMSVIEPIASDDIKVRLRAALENTARAMKAEETDDIKSVELALEKTIEDVTGTEWYKATDVDIFWDLFNNKSVVHTIDAIIDNLHKDEEDDEFEIKELTESVLSKDEAIAHAKAYMNELDGILGVLYGVTYKGKKEPEFFSPVVIEDEDELAQMSKGVDQMYVLYNKKLSPWERKELGTNENCVVCEDTVKQGSYWVNKGKEGTHGKFKTKKEADAQRKAMYARGFREELKFVGDGRVIDREELPKLGDKIKDETITEVKKVDERDGYEIYRVEYTDNDYVEINANDPDGFKVDVRHFTYAVPVAEGRFAKRLKEEKLEEKIAPKDFNPTITGTAYKVFKVKNGKLYPPMVANAGGEDTPVGVWLDAEEGEFAGLSKTGRMKVKSSGGGTLAYRPGWHLGDIPLAKQFYRTNKETGEKEFPKDFVWAEVEYVADVDYQDEAMSYGYTPSGKFQHSLAGLPKIPKDGYYRYRTNPNPDTVPWIITGAMKVKRLLDDKEVADILAKQGIEAPKREGGEKTLAELGLKQIGA